MKRSIPRSIPGVIRSRSGVRNPLDEDEYNYDDHDDCDDTTASGLRTPDLDLITPGIERGIDRFIADFPPHKDEYESMVELLPSSPLLISRFASMCN
jgi:hypothetical protein